MFRFLRRLGQKAGAPAGTLEYVGGERSFTPGVEIAVFKEDGVEFRMAPRSGPFLDAGGRMAWIRVVGLHDPELIRGVGRELGLHPLLLEDAMNSGAPPVFAEEGRWCFLILKSIRHSSGGELASQHLALAWDGETIVTFQQNQTAAWDAVEHQLANASARFSKNTSAFLAAALLDAVVDENLSAAADLAGQMEQLEQGVLQEQNRRILMDIYAAKRDLIHIKNTLRLSLDVLRKIKTHDLVRQAPEAAAYFADVQEHLHQAVETAESLHGLAGDLLNLSFSLSGLRMNSIMKHLTAFASIFIPLTFIAGIYGMNFHFMPELSYKYGYFIVLGAMAVLGVGLGLYFSRKKWF